VERVWLCCSLKGGLVVDGGGVGRRGGACGGSGEEEGGGAEGQGSIILEGDIGEWGAGATTSVHGEQCFQGFRCLDTSDVLIVTSMAAVNHGNRDDRYAMRGNNLPAIMASKTRSCVPVAQAPWYDCVGSGARESRSLVVLERALLLRPRCSKRPHSLIAQSDECETVGGGVPAFSLGRPIAPKRPFVRIPVGTRYHPVECRCHLQQPGMEALGAVSRKNSWWKRSLFDVVAQSPRNRGLLGRCPAARRLGLAGAKLAGVNWIQHSFVPRSRLRAGAPDLALRSAPPGLRLK
jgi:hypothetical protein